MEWINVKDKLPENGQQVDVWRGGHMQFRDTEIYYLDDADWDCGFYFDNSFESEVCTVTHWMPLPEPPK